MPWRQVLAEREPQTREKLTRAGQLPDVRQVLAQLEVRDLVPAHLPMRERAAIVLLVYAGEDPTPVGHFALGIPLRLAPWRPALRLLDHYATNHVDGPTRRWPWASTARRAIPHRDRRWAIFLAASRCNGSNPDQKGRIWLWHRSVYYRLIQSGMGDLEAYQSSLTRKRMDSTPKAQSAIASHHALPNLK